MIVKKLFTYLTLLSIALTYIRADCPCDGRLCPDGMTCSEKLQHCVCQNIRDYTGESIIDLPATVFDFKASNQDFENGEPDWVEVANILALDDNPWFVNSDPRFASWYKHMDGINMNTTVTLQLIRQDDGSYHYDGMEYFPIDNQLFGNEGFEHNYHFTTKTSWSFDYMGGEFMKLVIDDGILVYINRKLVINEPGLNYLLEINLDLDEIAAELGLAQGYTYPIHFFHMERHKWHSQMDIKTNMILHPQTCQGICKDDPDCGNGICHPFERQCKCQRGWSGDYCDQSVCTNSNCGENGLCSPYDGKCYCNEGWAGDFCNIRTCRYRGDFVTDSSWTCDPNKHKISPVLECVEELEDGLLRAHFGYLNRDCDDIYIRVGDHKNKFSPSPNNRDQVEWFLSGRHRDIFTVDFNSSETKNLVWTLKSPDGSGRTSTASNGSVRCGNLNGIVDGNCQCDDMYTGENCEKCVEQYNDKYYLCRQSGNYWDLFLVNELREGIGYAIPGTNGLDCQCRLTPEWVYIDVNNNGDNKDEHGNNDGNDDDDSNENNDDDEYDKNDNDEDDGDNNDDEDDKNDNDEDDGDNNDDKNDRRNIGAYKRNTQGKATSDNEFYKRRIEILQSNSINSESSNVIKLAYYWIMMFLIIFAILF